METMKLIHKAQTLAAACALALPAFAADFGPEPPVLAEMPSQATIQSGDSIHAGGATAADTTLAMEVAAALSADPRLHGATITVSASNGGISLSGSAQTPQQAAYAEQRAREVAGVNAVSGTLSPIAG